MRVFLDVGAHNGQTLEAVKPAEFEFDQIVCFEPAPQCWSALQALADDRVRIEYFGLWNRTENKPLYQPGTMGAGMWKKDGGKSDRTEVCSFVQASLWTKLYIRRGDTVFLKLNCEGAECDIVDDLLDSGEFEKISHLMIDFDVRKIESMKHRQAEVMERLKPYPFPRVASKESRLGATHAERIQHWLRLCH